MADPHEALAIATQTLIDVTQTGSTDADRVKASVALADIAQKQLETQRRAAVAHQLAPLLGLISRNLSGGLTPEDPFTPVYELKPNEQANLALHLGRLAAGVS